MEAKDTIVFVAKPEELFLEVDDIRRDCSFEELIDLHNAMVSVLVQQKILHYVIDCVNLDDRVRFVSDTVLQRWPWLADEIDQIL